MSEKNIKLSRKPIDVHIKTLGKRYAAATQSLIWILRILASGASLSNKYNESIE